MLENKFQQIHYQKGFLFLNQQNNMYYINIKKEGTRVQITLAKKGKCWHLSVPNRQGFSHKKHFDKNTQEQS